MFKQIDATTRLYYKHEVIATEFAVVLGHSRGVLVHFLPVKALGFKIPTSRSQVYQKARNEHLGADIPGAISADIMVVATPEQGILHVLSGSGSRQDGRYFYGFKIDWPNGVFRCEHDIALPTDLIDPDSVLVLGAARQR